MAQPTMVDDYQAALVTLQEAGHKLTAPRKTILHYLVSTDQYPTADMIYQDLLKQGHQYSLATIYNTLDILETCQLVLAIDSEQDGKRHYDYFGHPHYHVICVRCGRIADANNFDFSQLPNAASQATGYHIQNYEVMVKGLCPQCQERLATDQTEID
ncbi:Fur family transcriptional regulator [Weissella halotolerans]|uniref:Transcriptional repressor n=1 Tax=Weissella halotolerans DSM 20190 TaxID=1123500 RepID=A0A0R2G9S4_9LACO|nr:Fur family transcriptional regulator [Weissella halotolerans]KRN33437.1 hypothetical protein IV68_GL000237 [Weissella halotolerans DSM 20190]